MNFLCVIPLILLTTRLHSTGAQPTDLTEKSNLLNTDVKDGQKGLINNINSIFKPQREDLITTTPKVKEKPSVLEIQTLSPEELYGTYPKPPGPTIEQAYFRKPSRSPPRERDDSQPVNNRYEPNTIQEWMNQNRPVSALKKPTRPPNDEMPFDDRPMNVMPIRKINQNQNQDVMQPIRPSYDPPPWDKPNLEPIDLKPDREEEDDPWVRPNSKTTTTPNPKLKSSERPELGGGSALKEEDYQKPDKPRKKPLLIRPEVRPPSVNWDEMPYRPDANAKPSKPQPEPTQPDPSGGAEPSVWEGNPNLPQWWNSPPGHPDFEAQHDLESDINGFGGNAFGDNSGNGIGGMGDLNGIGGAIIGSNSGNGEGGVGNFNGLGGNLIVHNGANGVGGVGNDNGLGGFIIGNNSGNGKGGIGNNNGVGGNKGGKNSANGTGGVGNNNGKGGIIVGNNSGNGVGGVNQNESYHQKQND